MTAAARAIGSCFLCMTPRDNRQWQCQEDANHYPELPVRSTKVVRGCYCRHGKDQDLDKRQQEALSNGRATKNMANPKA